MVLYFANRLTQFMIGLRSHSPILAYNSCCIILPNYLHTITDKCDRGVGFFFEGVINPHMMNSNNKYIISLSQRIREGKAARSPSGGMAGKDLEVTLNRVENKLPSSFSNCQVRTF